MTTRLALALPVLASVAFLIGCSTAPEVADTPTPSAGPDSTWPSEPPPTTVRPLPLARNGSDLNSCRDGRCQVVVTSPTTLTVGGITLTVTVQEDAVVVDGADASDNHAQIVARAGSTNSVGLGGRKITVRVLGVQQNRAVLDLS